MGLDYYGILELTKNSEDLDIKKAWVENNNMYSTIIIPWCELVALVQ